MAKVVDTIKQVMESGRHFFAFEYIAPTRESGLTSLYDCVERMSAMDPLFCGITWGDRGSTAETCIEVASTCQSLLSLNYQVNISGYSSTPAEVSHWLSILKAKGIRNLLVTRGHPTTPASDGKVHFPHAVDLIRYIRDQFGESFGIAVVAFPEKEDESLKSDEEMKFLKEKIDAGGDYIVTQCIFDAAVYADLCTRCRDHGIRCPIVPGIQPVAKIRQLKAFRLKRLSGAAQLIQRLESSKGDDAECRRIVVSFHREFIQKLFALGAGGVYVYTMNVEGVMAHIAKGMDISTHRAFPWKPSKNEKRRRSETARPIHWSSRVASYMVRTTEWSHFAAGEQWSAGSASGGGSAGYHARLLLRSRAKRCAQFLVLGGITEVPAALAELCRIFLSFLRGLGTLPWADELSGETEYVNEVLLKPLNARGLYTINSQPQINGVASSNRVVGWGPEDGYIYQKGYLEFFFPVQLRQTVFTTLEKYPSLQYMAMNRHGKMVQSRWPMEASTAATTHSSVATAAGSDLFGHGVTTVTWGVFPGREVVQPTFVSVDSFRAWVGEAFELWAAPFPGTDVPPILQMIQSEWVLVSIVDNMFQESPSPLERAVLEVCSKIPPLVPIDAVAQPPAAGRTHVGMSLTTAPIAAAATPSTAASHHPLPPPLPSTRGNEGELSPRRNRSYNDMDMNDFLHQQDKLLIKSQQDAAT